MNRVTTVSEYPYALRARRLPRERSIVDIDVAKPFPSIVFHSMVLVACIRRVDTNPSIVTAWTVVDFETNRLAGYGLQNLYGFFPLDGCWFLVLS